MFDASGDFVGKEYSIPEFVVMRVSPDGIRYYLSQYMKDKDGVHNVAWTARPDDAMTFSSWYQVQSVAQDVVDKDKYDAYKNCVEKDSVK